MVDPRAVSGFSHADAYERSRPSYPREAIATVVAELALAPTSSVLDLGAGTGKLTRLLVGHFADVVAVDPSRSMLSVLHEHLPPVDARVGAAEAIPLPDASVAAVFVGEAFHWFQTSQACAEIARTLTPSGGLVLLWNRARWSETDVPWLSEFNALVKPYREAAGSYPANAKAWRADVDRTRLFCEFSSAEFDHVTGRDLDDFVALVASWSWIANLDHSRRRAVLARMREIARETPRVTLRYRTEVHWTRRS